VGKYLSMIDEWKKRPLPLPYCKGEERSNMEQRAFASWYSNNVNLVRRRVVMALAGSRGDDSEESDAEGPSNVAINGKNSLSVRSLRKMMSNQAQEIENLQMKLEDALLTITSQSCQIKELKRVTELGTSAETINMVSEYTEKMAELEKIKGELKKEAENRIRLQEESMAAKDRDIVTVREELLECQTVLEEIRLDNETLREEMAGLSSAYNILELQYNQTNSGNNSTVASTEMTASGEDAAEDGGARNYSSGEAAAEIFGRSNSDEVQFLRDENVRLREEGKAANEWMSMAVSKMEEMSGENESLAQSLDKALANLASAESSDTDLLSIQHRMELQTVREEFEAKLKAKDDEIANQHAQVLQLENRLEEINLSININDETPSPLEELRQVVVRQELELESLRMANREAQDWMASAVTHVDKLTKEVLEKDEQLEKIGNPQHFGEDGSNDFKIKITELESNLKNVAAELNESHKKHEKLILEIGALQTENAALRKTIGDNKAHDSSDKEVITAELDQVKLEKVTLEANLNQFQSWSETAQIHLAEVEAKLKEATSERDDLIIRLKSSASRGFESSAQDYSALLESLRNELDEKNVQLERMQDQLIEDADEYEAKMDKLLEDVEVEKQGAEGLTQDKLRLSATVEKLSLEKEELSIKLSEKQAENDDLMTRLESYASVGHESSAHDYKELLESLRNELDEKNVQLERMQDQLIEDADEYEAKMDKLREDFEVEKEGTKSLIRAKSELIEKLSLEKEQLSSKLSESRALLDSVNAGKNDADTQVKEAQLRMSDLEAALLASEARVHNLTALEEQITLVTAERDDKQSQLNRFTEDYDNNQIEKNSLQNQLYELERKINEKDNAYFTLQHELDECKTVLEESVQIWQKRVQSLEGDVTSLEHQLEQQQSEATEAIAQWENRCSSLEEATSEENAQLWEKRTQSLEATVTSLENQLEQQEKEAAEAIALWESRCSTLEESGGLIIQQWEKRVQSLESDVTSLENQLEQQQKESAEAINQLEASCLAQGESNDIVIRQCEERVQSLEGDVISLENQVHQKEQEALESHAKFLEAEKSLGGAKDEFETISQQKKSLESTVALMTSQTDILNKQIEEKTIDIKRMQLQIQNKDESLANLDKQMSELSNELLEIQQRSELVVKQWQERSEQLEANIDEFELTIAEMKIRSDEAVQLWQERAENQEKEAAEAISDWEARCATLSERIETLELQLATSEQQKKLDDDAVSIDDLKEMLSVLRDENANLLQESKEALKEKDESQVVVFELKEELRHANEQLRSFATDQFTKRASEMATQALRKQIEEIRSRYSADQEALIGEIEARRSAEEEVERLKADLALLAQATEYDDAVDLHVRKVAKKMSAENVKAERNELEQLRSTLERLREELGSCRWNERQSVEIAANARLQISILEQEITAAKSDLALMKQALDDLEASKINMSVSFEYRIEVLENERLWTERSHEEEMQGVKAELAVSIEERDNMAHKLEQSEKANAALVYSTAHNGPEESESEVIKLQLERAHLLAKISEMGANLERRVREAVAAQVSSFEAELIVERRSRHLADASSADALAELEKVKTQMAVFASNSRSGDSPDSNQLTRGLEESVDDLRRTNDKLLNKNKLLQIKLDSISKENKSTINDLRDKLHKAQDDLRSQERESRFEAALAAEINNLRSTSHATFNDTPKRSQALVLQGMDQNTPSRTLFDEEKKSIDLNSAYVIEMYDYVCELKNSITEERQMYKDLLAEHEDLLALLGQTGLYGIQ
jgi:chromosome segregation ATPase